MSHVKEAPNIKLSQAYHSKNAFCPENKNFQNDHAEQKFIKRLLMQDVKEESLSNLLSGIELKKPYTYGKELDEKLCWSLREFKRNQFLESKRTQYRRESDQELKTAQKQIRSGYVAKTISAQIADNEILNHNKKLLDKMEDEFLIEKAKFKLSELEKNQLELDRKKKEDLKKVLMEQMQSKCDHKKLEHERYLKEKEAVFNYMLNLEEIQRQEFLKKKEIQNLRKLEMEECQRQRADWIRQKKLEDEEENRRIAAQVVSKDEEIQRAKEEKRRIQALKEEISDRIGKEIYNLQEAKRARQEFLQDLLVKEKQAMDDLKEKEAKEKSIREHSLLVSSVAQLTAERKSFEETEKLEEQKLYMEQISKAMEEDRIKEIDKEMKEAQKQREIAEQNTKVLLAKREEFASYKTGKIQQGVIDQKELERK